MLLKDKVRAEQMSLSDVSDVDLLLVLIATASCEYSATGYADLAKKSPENASKSLLERISELTHVLASEKESSNEIIQARICLAWLHWLLQDLKQVLAILQEDYITLLQHHLTDTWTYICLLKAAYFRTSSLVTLRGNDEAYKVSTRVLDWVNGDSSRVHGDTQVSYWAEQLLGCIAVSSAQSSMSEGFQASQIKSTLQSFRRWSTFAVGNREMPAPAYGNSSKHLSRFSIWQTDYIFVSRILQLGVEYPTDNAAHQCRQQVAELHRVETMYENELLRCVQFPHASEAGTVVEEWVEAAVRNWQIICGDSWREDELPEGGRNRLGRNLLEILYRGAAKTFHSTLILRRLFQVHKALADFDLAYMALDTYLELIERDRERSAESANIESGHDDDETVLRVLAEGIESLCSYGGKDEAEKAYEMSQKLNVWLDRAAVELNKESLVNGHTEGEVQDLPERTSELASATREVALRTIGIAQAHWALWTPVNEDRVSLQSDAVDTLRRALQQPVSDDGFFGSTYALSLVLAQTRDLDSAILCLKQLLMNRQSAEMEQDLVMSRKLLPLWHLLGLLLTAQQDFSTASQACAAAFEQLPPVDGLSGGVNHAQSGPQRLLSATVANPPPRRDFVDDAECDELQRMIEVRISELALIEVQNGPEDALNSCNRLLSEFARLFKQSGVVVGDIPSTKSLDPPRSSATTVKSFRGSLFGRKKLSRFSEETVKRPAEMTAPDEKVQNRPTTQSTSAPTIQVTDEDEKHSTHRHHIFRRSEDRQSSGTQSSPKSHRQHGSLSKVLHSPKKDQVRSVEKSTIVPSASKSKTSQAFQTSESGAGTWSEKPPETKDSDLHPQHTIDEVPAPPTAVHASSTHGAMKGGEATNNFESHRTLTALEQSAAPTTSTEQSSVSGTKTNKTAKWRTPATRFPRSTKQKHSLGLLCKVWLVIAMLYRRSSMFDDAREACDEAAKCAAKIETSVASVESSARAFASRGWGGSRKSSDEIWADVYCERGQLALSIAHFAEEKAKGEIVIDHEKVHEAVEHFEQCLMYYPDHPKGIVGLSGVLLDYFEKKVELGRRVDDGKPKEEQRQRPKRPSEIKISNPLQNGSTMEPRPAATSSTTQLPSAGQTDEELRKTPENLNRLAARDRAYGLLSTLTKLGNGWDDSEAWFALARAHELGGEFDRAKEIFWWCVELEDKRPIRHWRNLSCTGYVL